MGKTKFADIISNARTSRTKTQPNPNPLESLEITGNIQTDDNNEWDTIEQHLKQADTNHETMTGRDKAKQGLQRSQKMGYVIPLIFVTQEQADEFLKLTGWDKHADPTNAYFDGIAIAQSLGHKLKPTPINFHNGKPATRLIRELGTLKGGE
jgi:hypothetical protein